MEQNFNSKKQHKKLYFTTANFHRVYIIVIEVVRDLNLLFAIYLVAIDVKVVYFSYYFTKQI